MKCFLLLTWQSNEGVGQAAYALVGIDEAKAKDILAKKELFQMAKAREPTLCQLSFWDCRCYFYSSDAGGEIEDFLGDEAEMNAFLEDGKRVVGEDFSPSDHFETRTDADRLVIVEDGFFWCANSHHGDERFETRKISFEEILQV